MLVVAGAAKTEGLVVAGAPKGELALVVATFPKIELGTVVTVSPLSVGVCAGVVVAAEAEIVAKVPLDDTVPNNPDEVVTGAELVTEANRPGMVGVDCPKILPLCVEGEATDENNSVLVEAGVFVLTESDPDSSEALSPNATVIFTVVLGLLVLEREEAEVSATVTEGIPAFPTESFPSSSPEEMPGLETVSDAPEATSFEDGP